MKMYKIQLLACVIVSVIARATTYSTGAPAEGCWSERPLHRDYLPRGGQFLPYRITTNTTTYGPREIIEVTIDSPQGVPHKGFLLRIVTSSSHRGGRWAVDPSLQRYNRECGVTHTDPRRRNSTTVLWRAPSATLGDLGNIQFKAIVVLNMSHFWDNILSATLKADYPDGNKSTLRRFQRMFSVLTPTNSESTSRLPQVSSTLQASSGNLTSANRASDQPLFPKTSRGLRTQGDGDSKGGNPSASATSSTSKTSSSLT